MDPLHSSLSSVKAQAVPCGSGGACESCLGDAPDGTEPALYQGEDRRARGEVTSAWTTPRRIPGGAGFGAPARLTHFSSTPTWYPCLQFLWLILRQHRQCQGDEREHPHCYQQRILSASSYGKPDQWCLNCKAITIYLTKPRREAAPGWDHWFSNVKKKLGSPHYHSEHFDSSPSS